MVSRLLALGLMLTAASAFGATHTVSIEAMQFSPASLTVKRGDVVAWANKDLVPHTATSATGKAFDSKSIAPGASWRMTAKKPGRYEYVCTLHPTMKAVLVVE